MWSQTNTPSQPASSASAAIAATTRGSASSSKTGRNSACFTAAAVASASPLAARLPEDVAVGGGRAGQDEQQVGEPVEVERGLPVGPCRVDLDQRPDRPLRPAHDGPGDVQQGRP